MRRPIQKLFGPRDNIQSLEFKHTTLRQVIFLSLRVNFCQSDPWQQNLEPNLKPLVTSIFVFLKIDLFNFRFRPLFTPTINNKQLTHVQDRLHATKHVLSLFRTCFSFGEQKKGNANNLYIISTAAQNGCFFFNLKMYNSFCVLENK